MSLCRQFRPKPFVSLCRQFCKTLCLLFKKFILFISWLVFPKITFWEKPVASPGALSDWRTDGRTDTSRTGFVGLWPLQFFYSLGVRFFFLKCEIYLRKRHDPIKKSISGGPSSQRNRTPQRGIDPFASSEGRSSCQRGALFDEKRHHVRVVLHRFKSVNPQGPSRKKRLKILF